MLVKLVRFLLIVAYGSYLTNVGLILVLLPWTETWTYIILKLPPEMAFILDSPAMKGGISAFGFLHLLMILAELTPKMSDSHR